MHNTCDMTLTESRERDRASEVDKKKDFFSTRSNGIKKFKLNLYFLLLFTYIITSIICYCIWSIVTVDVQDEYSEE